MAVLRYIHQNPVKAGICNEVGGYGFSSYNDYINGNDELVDISFAFSLLSRDEFIRFNNETSADKCLDYDEGYRLNDTDARVIIHEISKCKNAAEFQALDNEIRDGYIKKIKDAGLSIRQISRLTGISFSIVRKK